MTALTQYRQIVTDVGHFRVRPGWCATHNDFAWEFTDGGISCFHEAVVEGASMDCKFVRGILALPRGTIRQPRRGAK